METRNVGVRPHEKLKHRGNPEIFASQGFSLQYVTVKTFA
jgi:hypothetical protein